MIILTRGIAGLCSTVMASLAEGRPFTQRREGRIRRPRGSNWRTRVLAGFLTTIVISNSTYAQPGQVLNTRLTSPALEGNKLGDPATRSARVYLPPSYETSTRRYPVAYYLHGLGGDQNAFFNDQGHLRADGLIQEGTMEEMIIVGVDGTGGQTTTGFLNSELNGNYADYITQDLVDHIDTTFRTIADRESRAIFGGSYGGQATLHYAMMHSDVFGAAYALSSGIVTSFSRPGSFLYLGGEKAEFADYSNAAGNDLAGVKTPSDIQSSFLRLAAYGMASVFSPNLDNPPLHVDLPFEVPSLEIIPEVRDKWLEYDHFLMLEDHVSELSSLRGLAFDVGDRDNASNIRENTAFHEALVAVGVPHQFEAFSGGHSDKLSERLEKSLVFLSNSLYGSAIDVYDCNGDGILTVLDADCAPAESLAETLAAANLIIGDANGDGEVQFADFLILSDNFGTPGQYTDGDFDKDGHVRFADFLILSQNFGQSTVAVVGVPEPSIAIHFLVLVFVAMFSRAFLRSAVAGNG